MTANGEVVWIGVTAKIVLHVDLLLSSDSENNARS
jgi:hypothetical protein